MPEARPLSIPVILGTSRKGRRSVHAARYIHGKLGARPGITSALIDIAALPLPVDDAGEGIKTPQFADQMERADAVVIVSPEYNHSFPGLLKHALDSCLKEYVHKAAGIVGVSAGVFGGARMIENMLPVLRELGLVTIFWDLNFGGVGRVFDASGALVDTAFEQRAAQFLDELVWMARTLRHGRENIPLS